jgi:hypothetical protein
VGHRQKVFDHGEGMIKQGDRAQANYRRSETLPGTPVLATPVGAIPDVIIDDKTGFIMGNNSPECTECIAEYGGSLWWSSLRSRGWRIIGERFFGISNKHIRC